MPPELIEFLKAYFGGRQQQQQTDPYQGMAALLREARNDPQRDHNKQWTMTGPGGGFDMAKAAGFFGPELSPTAKLASQGPSAVNQWAQIATGPATPMQGPVRPGEDLGDFQEGAVPGIDTRQLSALMRQREQTLNPVGIPDQGRVTGVFGYESPLPQGASRVFNPGGMPGVGMVKRGEEVGFAGSGRPTGVTSGTYNFPSGGRPTTYKSNKRRGFGFGGIMR